jgi:hypothetical protein
VNVRTVVADEKGMIYVLCPFCGDNSLKPVKLFPIHQPVSMACSCGKTYEFQIEIRKDFRRVTAIDGFYVKEDYSSHFEKMTVIDLSLDGCCMLVSDKHALHLGDWIKVVFKLDNAKRTHIKRSATVIRIMGNKISCRLVTDAYDPELGFYVKDFKVPQ